MNILVVAGCCLQVNSSANLCHISYIQGLLHCGHTVDLISASNKNQNIDPGIQMPAVRHHYQYNVSFYEQLSVKKRSNAASNTVQHNETTSLGSSKISTIERIKNTLMKLYGIYRTDIIWYLHAKHWRSTEKYDYVISLAYPPISHKLVAHLINKKHLFAKQWIQIWEDPWYSDIYGFDHNSQVAQEESLLVSECDRVYYVSPLTLMYQQDAFPESAEKMRWQPLPTYYKKENADMCFDKLYFGYFGDYSPVVRNLQPFYNVAEKMNLQTFICGNSSNRFQNTDSVTVYPRMGLNELAKYEDQTNVLVFLCNLKGGQIPGKIYQYAATNKLILFILDGTAEEKKVLHDYFERFHRFIFCENDEESIENAIVSIQKNLENASYYTPITYFEPENIMHNILDGK